MHFLLRGALKAPPTTDMVKSDNGLIKFNVKVINEGLRLAPVAFTGRTCTKEWQIPGDSFVVPKGTRVIIPIVSLIFLINSKDA